MVYTLPPLPRQLRDELEAAKSVVQLTSSTTHRFVRVLYEDVTQYTLYVCYVPQQLAVILQFFSLK